MHPRYDVRIGHYQFKRAHGASWLRIFYQRKYSLSEGFESKTQCSEYISDSMYSILEQSSHYSPQEGKYEFLLEYPGIRGYNHWKQTYFPTNVSDSIGTYPVEGYENISISWDRNIHEWGGLALSLTSFTLIDGSIGVNDFWYSICYLKNVGSYDDKMPGPELVHEVILWMRISDIFYPTCRIHRHFFTHFHYFISSFFVSLYL